MITLRDYRPDDLEELFALDQVCFTEGISYTRKELAGYIEMRGAFTIVADAGGGPIPGYLIAHADRRGIGHIITIDVRDDSRRSGLGSQMLKAAEAKLVAGGCSRVLLEVAVDNAAAISFYKRHGYTVLKTLPRYYLDAIDALVMGKSLGEESGKGRAGSAE